MQAISGSYSKVNKSGRIKYENHIKYKFVQMKTSPWIENKNEDNSQFYTVNLYLIKFYLDHLSLFACQFILLLF